MLDFDNMVVKQCMVTNWSRKPEAYGFARCDDTGENVWMPVHVCDRLRAQNRVDGFGAMLWLRLIPNEHDPNKTPWMAVGEEPPAKDRVAELEAALAELRARVEWLECDEEVEG